MNLDENLRPESPDNLRGPVRQFTVSFQGVPIVDDKAMLQLEEVARRRLVQRDYPTLMESDAVLDGIILSAGAGCVS